MTFYQKYKELFLDNIITSHWPSFGVIWSNGCGERLYQVFEYSDLFPCTQKWCKLSNGLDDLKVALYVCPIHIDDGIHSDHSYLEVLEKPLCSTLNGNDKDLKDTLIFWGTQLTLGFTTVNSLRCNGLQTHV